MQLFGGIEAGGTKVVCLVGAGPDDIRREERFPTTTPAETLQRAVDFFRPDVHLAAIGIASFGPLELRPDAPAFGHITATPKPGWSGSDVRGAVAAAFDGPVVIDTDVNGAVVAECKWGAGRGLTSVAYLTLGTGIGGGLALDGHPVHGLVHPEMGHVTVPRRQGDDFAGVCPFHGDCFEGMASGAALAARWGRPAEQLTGDLGAAVETEAWYVAAGLRQLVYVAAPQRIIIGGGVSGLPGLIPAIRTQLALQLAGYPGLEEHLADDFVSPAALGDRAGPLGALALAMTAA